MRIGRLRVGGVGVPAAAALGFRNSHPLHRVRHHHDRLAAGEHPARPVEDGGECVEVVSVDLLDVPAEGTPLVGDRLDCEPAREQAPRHHLVVVEDRDQVVEAKVRRRHRRLPDAALGRFSVADDAVDAAGFEVLQSKRERMTLRLGEAEPEQAARRLETRCRAHVRVALQPPAQLAVVVDLLDGEEATERQGGVEPGRGMRLGQDQPVAFGPVRLVGSEPELTEVQEREDLGHRHRAGDVGPIGRRRPSRRSSGGSRRRPIPAAFARHLRDEGSASCVPLYTRIPSEPPGRRQLSLPRHRDWLRCSCTSPGRFR